MLVPTATTVAPPVAPPTAVVPSTPPLPDLKPKLEPKHEPEENGDQAEYGLASAGSSTSSIPKPAASSKDSSNQVFVFLTFTGLALGFGMKTMSIPLKMCFIPLFTAILWG